MLDPRLLKKLLQERILSQGSPGAQPFAMGGDVASQVKQALQPISPVGDNTQDIYGRGLSPVPERGPMISGADDQGIGNMGDRMRGIQGASGGGGEGGGPSIGQIIGLALEGFASGAQGRAPQGPGLMMQAQAQKNQQGIANRKLEMDEQEFGLKKQQIELATKEKEAQADLRTRIRKASESMLDPANPDVTQSIGSLAGLFAESGDSSAAIQAIKLLSDEKSRGTFTTFISKFAGQKPNLEQITQEALNTGNKDIIDWTRQSIPLLKSAFDDNDPKTPPQVHVAAAKKLFPNDPEKQSNYVREQQRTPETPANEAYFKTLRDTGDEARAREAYLSLTQGRAESSSKGAAQGGLAVRRTPEYVQSQGQIAEEQARARGKPEAEKRLIQTEGTRQIVDRVGELVDKLPSGEGLKRFIVGGKLRVEALTQSNPDAAELQTLRQSYATNLSRSILSERGVLTEQDRAFAMDAIPALMDTAEIRKRKLGQMRRMTNIIAKGEEDLAAGKPIDPKTFRRDLRDSAIEPKSMSEEEYRKRVREGR